MEPRILAIAQTLNLKTLLSESDYLFALPSAQLQITQVTTLQACFQSLSEKSPNLIIFELPANQDEALHAFTTLLDAISGIPLLAISAPQHRDMLTRRPADIQHDYLLSNELTPNLLARSIRHLLNVAVPQNSAGTDADYRKAELKLAEAQQALDAKIRSRTRALRQANEYLMTQISERRRVERDLQRTLLESEQSRDRTAAILKSVGDGLIVTDLHHRILIMNPSAEALLDIHLNQVVGETVKNAIPNPLLAERIATSLRNSQGYEFDYMTAKPKKSDTERIIRARTAIVKDKQKKATGVITIMHDVTRERELDQMKNEFISTAAHQLRTPLTSIQGFSEVLLLREDLSTESIRKYLGYIRKQSLALAKIVDELLDISRIEAGYRFDLQKSTHAIAPLVDKAHESFGSDYPAHNFSITLDPTITEWYADEEKLQQVLEKILNNAVKYSPQGGQIRVWSTHYQAANQNLQFYQLSISDEGIGMTPEEVSQVFEAFYRADSSNTAIEGIGLSMVVVKNIIEAHGGRIWVDSAPEQGTTVSFAIPVSNTL